MFEAKKEIHDAVDRLFRQCSRLQRGDVFHHSTITGITGLEPYEGPWNRIVYLLKRRMIEEKRTSIWCDPTIGYRLCTIDEQIKLGHVYKVRARRRIKRGIRAVEALAGSSLSMRQREHQRFQSDTLRMLHRDLSAQIQARLPTHRPTPVLPRNRPERPDPIPVHPRSE